MNIRLHTIDNVRLALSMITCADTLLGVGVDKGPLDDVMRHGRQN
jgi:hypothetical protein